MPMNAPFTALAESFSRRDRTAIRSYEEICSRDGTAPTDEGRLAWVREWRQLDEDERANAAEAQQEENWRYVGPEGP